jgi:hypothetical protein
MSGGSGGNNAQMPMASNQGQMMNQMQNAQGGQGMGQRMGGMFGSMFGGMQPQMGGGQGRRFDFEGGGMGGGMQPQGQMPLEAYRGQQPQGLMPMTPGIAPQSGMFGRPQLNQQQQQAFDQMRQSNFMAPQRPQGPYETPQPMPQMDGGMGMIDQQRQAQDQFAMQLAQQAQQAQTGNMDPMGRMPMQTNQPYAMPMQTQTTVSPTPGAAPSPQFLQQIQQDQARQLAQQAQRAQQGMGLPQQGMGGGQQMPIPQGIQDLLRQSQSYAQSQMGGPSMTQLVNGPNPQVQRDIRPTNMQPSAIGSQTAYRPSMGAIDGRDLTKKLDITKRRQMDDLPGAIQNNLPPALKRPTQGGMRGVRV